MRTIQTFTNLSEAGFASSLLEAADIRAFLADEHSFALGYETPAIGIRLQVEDADFDRAQRVLTSGLDAAGPPPAPVETPQVERGGAPSSLLFVIIAGVAVLAFAGYWARESQRTARSRVAEQTYDMDYNSDGKPDHFSTYRGERFAHSESDRNFDGKPDCWMFGGRDGIAKRDEVDENFDGKPDHWFAYRNGVVATSRADVDFDGRPDFFTRYEHGVPAETNVRPGDTSVVVRRYLLSHGILREEWVDENADGVFDYKIMNDLFGAQSARIPIAPAK